MKVAVVGIGEVAPMHIQAIMANNQNIVALCDNVISRTEDAKIKFGLDCNVYSDYIQMLNTEKPDVVHICTPHYLHAEMVCSALERDINVFCEKPLAISEEELLKIKEKLNASKGRLGVSQQNRYKSAMQYVKKFFEDKPIISASGTLIWNRDEKYYAQGEWRGKKATEGGGVMINQALHTLDILQWFCGMPKTVKAHVCNFSLKNVIDVEDSAFGLFTLENGGNFVLFATNTSSIR